jgi:hypothetical protein
MTFYETDDPNMQSQIFSSVMFYLAAETALIHFNISS